MAQKPKNPARWRVTRLKGRAAVEIGTVSAPDADTAIEAAIRNYEITDPEQQKRLAAHRVA